MKTIGVRGCTQPTHQLKYIPQTLTCSELQGGHLREKQTLQPPSESQIAALGNNHVEHTENRSPGNKWLTTAATCTQHPQEQDHRKEVNLSVGCNEGGRSHSWAGGTSQRLTFGRARLEEWRGHKGHSSGSSRCLLGWKTLGGSPHPLVPLVHPLLCHFCLNRSDQV